MYSLKTEDGLQAAFCDFTKGDDDVTSLQTNIGTLMTMEGRQETIAFAASGEGDVRSKSFVSFPNRHYGQEYFDGKTFKAPVSGYYTFTFSGESYDDYSKIEVHGAWTYSYYNYESESKDIRRSFTQVFSVHLDKAGEIYLSTECDSGQMCLKRTRFFIGQLMYPTN